MLVTKSCLSNANTTELLTSTGDDCSDPPSDSRTLIDRASVTDATKEFVNISGEAPGSVCCLCRATVGLQPFCLCLDSPAMLRTKTHRMRAMTGGKRENAATEKKADQMQAGHAQHLIPEQNPPSDQLRKSLRP